MKTVILELYFLCSPLNLFRMKNWYLYRIVAVVIFAFCVMSTEPSNAQCPTGQSQVMVVIDPDTYAASETDWYLRDINGTLLASGSTAGATMCVSNTTCLTFTITDTYGDGLYTANNPGSYEYITTAFW